MIKYITRPKPKPKPKPGNLPWRQFATRCGIPNVHNFIFTAVRSRSGHYARSNVTAVKLLFPNWYIDGLLMNQTWEEKPLGTQSLLASIEYPLGQFTRVKFAGADTGIVPAGGSLLSDATSIGISNGDMFWVRTVLTGGGTLFESGESFESSPAIYNAVTFGDTCDVNNAADNTMGGPYNGAANDGYIYRPAVIAAQTSNAAPLILGDSKSHGSGGGEDASGDYGEIAPSVGPFHGYNNYSLGTYAGYRVIASHSRLQTLKPYFSHLICQFGVTDYTDAAPTGAAVLATMQTVWNYFSGLTICHSTLAPFTNSSDNWNTVGGQTLRPFEPERVAFNNLLRAGPTGLNVLFEVADVVETARNSGLWKAGYTADGIHESQAGYSAIKASGAISPALTGVSFGPVGDAQTITLKTVDNANNVMETFGVRIV